MDKIMIFDKTVVKHAAYIRKMSMEWSALEGAAISLLTYANLMLFVCKCSFVRLFLVVLYWCYFQFGCMCGLRV